MSKNNGEESKKKKRKGIKMKNYKIQDREAGNVIETGLTLEEAETKLAQFEERDKEQGIYEEDFYEIVEE